MKFQKGLWKIDRIDAGLKQLEEAELLGVKQSYLSQIETGKREPSRKILLAKAALYERLPRYYYGINDDKIFDRATEAFQVLLDLPLNTDKLRPRDMIQLIKLAKILESKLESKTPPGIPSEAQRRIEATVEGDLEDLLPVGVTPFDEIKE